MRATVNKINIYIVKSKSPMASGHYIINRSKCISDATSLKSVVFYQALMGPKSVQRKKIKFHYNNASIVTQCS